MYDHSKPLIYDDRRPGVIGKLFKLITILISIIVITLLGLTVFVQFYFTDARLKKLILPQAEAALGRTVEIGNININILSGIVIEELAIKEADKTSNFLAVQKFVLSLNLLPLLHKKIVVSGITFDNPWCRISRDKHGNFNFDSLALLTKQAEKPAPKKVKPKTAAKSAALPLALTVDRITINNAKILIADAKNEIPQIDADLSAEFGVDLATSLADMALKGEFSFEADVVHGKIKPHLSGKGSFENRDATFTLLIDAEQQKLKIVASTTNLTAKPLPPVQVDISSDKLGLDALIALADKLPKTTPQKNSHKQKPTAIAAGLPPGLELSGSVNIREALYDNKSAIHDLTFIYKLEKGFATARDLSLKMAGGVVAGKAHIDLTKINPTYSGSFSLADLQLHEMLDYFVSPQANMLSGGIAADLKVSGAGITANLIKKHMNMDATYEMNGARLTESPISKSVADALKLEQLKTINFNNIAGTLRMHKGKLKIESLLDSDDVKVQVDGHIGVVNGALNLPLEIEFSGDTADQLKNRSSIFSYLTDKEGNPAVNLMIAGTTSSPKVTLNKAAVEKQFKNKAMEEIGNKLLDTTPPKDNTDSENATEKIDEILKKNEKSIKFLKDIFGN